MWYLPDTKWKRFGIGSRNLAKNGPTTVLADDFSTGSRCQFPEAVCCRRSIELKDFLGNQMQRAGWCYLSVTVVCGVQDRIKAYEIPVAFLSNFDSNDIDELFLRVQFGMQLTPVEKIKVVRSSSRETIRTVAADRKVCKRMLRYQMRFSWECGSPAWCGS